MDLSVFLKNISIWAIPVIFAITWHEVAHGWMARFFGDRTAELLGRLSLNPLHHIDPIGTLLVPAVLLATGGSLTLWGAVTVGGPVIGWSRSVPVATQGLRHPRRVAVLVSLAGPLANLAMASVWGAALAGVAHVTGNQTVINWLALMAQAGIVVNLVLAVFNLLPIPPLAGGRIMLEFLPQSLRTYGEAMVPAGLLIAVGLSILRCFDWLFEPTLRTIGRIIMTLLTV